ncbi:MAG: alpha/beta hydrolase [Muribaculaceae bacterium]|nr:alpha/beta hydrolase [Muribaculaceae bacterium]
MKKRSILTLMAAALLSAGSLFAKPGIPLVLYPSHEEQIKMLNEADDFIDDMADGLQDRQADAVYHAMRGMGGELATVRNMRNGVSTPAAGVERIDIKGDGSARGIAMRLYRPEKKSKSALPLLVYFHGGGWTIGSLNSCAEFCDALAATGDMMVLAVDYRLAPENPFPDGINDCVGSVEYALSHAKEWGSSTGLISVGGDSAGGNLALATAMEMAQRDDVKEKLRSVVLIYPVTKVYNDKSASWKEYSRGYGLDGRLMEAFNEAYLFGSKPTESAIKNPKVSPAHASDADLKNLPPVLMISAQRDILYDQGKEFTSRLKKLGKSVDHVDFPGAIHTFATVKGQPTAFKKAVMLTSAFLKE